MRAPQSGRAAADDDSFSDQDPALAALMRASIRGELFDPPEVLPRHSGTKAQQRALPKPDGRNCAVAGLGPPRPAERALAPRVAAPYPTA